MKKVLNSLALVTFVITMRIVHAHHLVGLFDDLHVTGDDALLELSLLGKDEKYNKNYAELARKLTVESNIILADIDRYLGRSCDFGRQLPAKVNALKIQINKVSGALATSGKNKKGKEIVKLELDNLENLLRELDLQVNRLLSKKSNKCEQIFIYIQTSLARLRGSVAAIVVSM